MSDKVIPLPWLQSIITEKKMPDSVFFQLTDLLDNSDRSNRVDDEAVLEPLISFLAKLGDDVIFAFDDKMAELLYALDTKDIKERMNKENAMEYSADDFLYARCVALVNGESLYNSIVSGTRKLSWNLEYRPILYVPAKAWARLHNESRNQYPHKYSYEVFDSIGR